MTMSSSFPVLVVPFVFALFAFSDLFFLVAGHDCGWNEKETKTLCWYTHVEGILLQLFSTAEQVLDPFHHQFWQLPILINYTISCTGNDKKDILYNQVSYLRSHLRRKKKKKKKRKEKRKTKIQRHTLPWTRPIWDYPYHHATDLIHHTGATARDGAIHYDRGQSCLARLGSARDGLALPHLHLRSGPHLNQKLDVTFPSNASSVYQDAHTEGTSRFFELQTSNKLITSDDA